MRLSIDFNTQIKAHLHGVLLLFSAILMVQKYLSHLSESQCLYDGGKVGGEGLYEV